MSKPYPMPYAKKNEKCLIPSCKRYTHTRGLCTSCYQQARGAVKMKITTWEEIEKKGMSKPKIGKTGLFMRYFNKNNK